ncbi:MAG: phospho-N-acetylmuramoyl-pentapeptide-transferase [Rikenellaceae bacterium]|nr:phospho-N-acetylmuramoyl-pentapeptide-transferase [Rikenellaceae bacterium]
MLYSLAKYLDIEFDLPGAGMFQYLSFRATAAIIIALLIGMLFGGKIIRLISRKQIGEEIRDLGLAGQLEKRGTPTMGGLLIIASILIPVLLVGDLSNVYTQLMIGSTIWLGLLGFADDYIKVFRKDKNGLKGVFKIIGQVGLGIIIGTTMWLHPDIVMKEIPSGINHNSEVIAQNNAEMPADQIRTVIDSDKAAKTTIPFVKGNEFDYGCIVGEKDDNGIATWLLYMLVAIFVITAVSNSANLTDGIDGLATGVSVPIVLVLGAFAWLSGNIIYAGYLNFMYIPGSGELLVYAAAMAGALMGFLWYNCFPAQVFMGDTGSLTIGGVIAVFALLIRKELLLPILCGIFLAESVSVIMQRSYFKYTKKKYGEGRRIFLMSPLHHHYQKQGMHESKIVVRSILVGILLAAFTLLTLKVR